jgi:hypothetical protein
MCCQLTTLTHNNAQLLRTDFIGRLDPPVVTEPANLLILGQKSWFCCPECERRKKRPYILRGSAVRHTANRPEQREMHRFTITSEAYICFSGDYPEKGDLFSDSLPGET